MRAASASSTCPSAAARAAARSPTAPGTSPAPTAARARVSRSATRRSGATAASPIRLARPRPISSASRGLPAATSTSHGDLVDVATHGLVVAGEAAGAPRGDLGAGHRPVGQGASGALDQVGRGGHGVPGGLGQLGHELAGAAREAGVRALDHRPGAPGQLATVGRQQVVEDRLAGEGVPERETVAVDLDELPVDQRPQRVGRGAPVDVGDPGHQLPVEPPSQHRGGADHPAGHGVQRREPPSHRLAQARGHVRR